VQHKKFYIISGFLVFSVFASLAWVSPLHDVIFRYNVRQNLFSSKADTVKKSGKRPKFKLKDRYANKFSEKTPASPFILKDPKNINTEFKLDSAGKISVYEKTKDLKGNDNFRPAERMTIQEFNNRQENRFMRDYWKKFAASQDGKDESSGRGLLPKIELPPAIDRIFGGTKIDFKPVGNITLDIGYMTNFYDNPTVPVNLRRQSNLDFKESAQISFQGKIGDKLNLNTNFDTKASFNFQNQLKLNWRTNEEDILQNVEVGNTSWQLNSQLIPGVQNLFGLKTLLRFGNLDITAVAAQQRSKQDCITLRGGTQGKNFEIKGSLYDENRHFFLSQYFRDNYERSLRNLPMITSGVTITRIEVYVTNRTQSTETLRNIVAFTDLGEGNPSNKTNPKTQTVGNKKLSPVDNLNNFLYQELKKDSIILRKSEETEFRLESNFNLRKGTDYDLVSGAKRLSDREYRFQPELGYISLITPLRNDEVLAVSYEYTKDGQRHQVGELTEDYQSLSETKVIFLKLLKSSTIRNNLSSPLWNLMMKNIYSLNSQQLTRQGFQFRVIYKDDQTGIDNPNLQEGEKIVDLERNLKLKETPLLRVMGLDKLNANNDPQVDGNFDYVEGVTVDSKNGKIIFPVLEPFGSSLKAQFKPDEVDLIDKYVFDKLYSSTQTDAIQLTGKDKFFLKGSFQSGIGGDVSLPFGVDGKSVTVTAGGVPLSPGTQYIVEPQSGRVRILDAGVSNSGREIKVCYEKPDLFNNQIRTLLGTHLDYTVGQNLHLGATIQHMSESPPGYLRRVQMGSEPVSNTIFGFDAAIQQKSKFLTRMIDALPLISTKEVSAFDFSGEYAQLIPAVNKDVQNNAFIDDFEAARNIFSLNSNVIAWRPGSTPQMFPQGNPKSLERHFKRAKISAYVADFTLYGTGGNSNLDGLGVDPVDISKYAYERSVSATDLFPNKAQPNNITGIPIGIMDVSYFPSERGIYNFNTDINTNGTLKNPTKNFGAITRAITSDTDFDNANIETLEFWLMNPLITTSNDVGVVRASGDIATDRINSNRRNDTGGKLIFNIGDISEDFVPDNSNNFENGIPAGEKVLEGVPNKRQNIKESVWGIAPSQQFVTNAFTNGSEQDRTSQDVGLDGLANVSPLRNDTYDEKTFFKPYLDKISAIITDPSGSKIKQDILEDPAGDDFHSYLSQKYNNVSSLILRYKDYMGLENNSPTSNATTTTNNNLGNTETNTQQPDREDLNQDNTVNDTEAYYQYEIDIKSEKMRVGQNYIVDKIVEPNGVEWFLFRIPLKSPTKAVGGINGLKSMRFIRTVLTEWEQPVVCRFAAFQLAGFQYRKFTGDLTPRGLQNVPEPYDAKFKVSAVNIEENGDVKGGSKSPQSVAYVVPPGFERDRDITTINNAQLNEQSMSLCVENLRTGDSRAAFKNSFSDFINYKNLKMFISMNSPDASIDKKVKAFVRFGTDLTENYYEIETQGLVRTAYGSPSAEEVWDANNEIDIPFDALKSVKLKRDRNNKKITEAFSDTVKTVGSNGKLKYYIVSVVGRPDLSTVLNTMIGVRNPISSDGQDRTFCIWVDELRASGFEQTSGQAAIGKLNLKLADFANITVNGSFKNYGFGGVQSKISERTRETTIEYGIAANINVDKLLPEKWGIKIPLYVTYDRKNIAPQFNPLDPDVPLDSSLANLNGSEADKANYKKSTEDNTERKGINFTNVRKIKTGQNTVSRPWDIENFTATYAYSELTRTNTLIDEYKQTQYKGGLTYSFTGNPKPIEPFKKMKSNHPLLRWVKDFNITPLPNSVTLRADMDRSFIKTQLRNIDPDASQGTGTPKLTTKGVPTLFEKYWLFNRAYNLNWNLTKSVVVGYAATVNAIIDEPFGGLETQSDRDSVARNLRRFGRTKGFDQQVNTVWRLPLNKSPLTDWMSADYSHRFGYTYYANSYEIRDGDVTNKDDQRGYLFGNVIKNTRVRSISGKIDFVSLYNRIRALRLANQPRVERKNVARNPGDDEDIIKPQPNFLRSVTRLLMAIRGIQVNYSIDESTSLAGFLPTPGILGMNGINAAPGLDFITGSQDPNIRFRASENGWLTKSNVLNTPFLQVKIQNLTYRTAIEPFRDFRIQLEGRWSRSDNYQELYRQDSAHTGFKNFSPVRSGNYSMSFLSFLTAFDSNSPDDNSVIFNRFRGYRQIMLDRLNAKNRADKLEGKYDLNSQDVLIPAFFAAYSGVSPDKVGFSPFVNIPLPNWQVDYNGLANVGWFKRNFSSIIIRHAYSSTYSVGNFVSSLGYKDVSLLTLDNMMYNTATLSKLQILKQEDISYTKQSAEDEFLVPIYAMSVITFQEKFSPFLSVDMTTKNKVSIKLSYNQDRNIGLNLANSYVNELSNKDFVVRVGFTPSTALGKGKGAKIASREGETNQRGGESVTSSIFGKSTQPVTFRRVLREMRFDATLTIKDTRTIQRKLDSSPVVSQGFTSFAFNPIASFEVNSKLLLSAYYEKNFNTPYVSNIYYRSEDRAGIRVTFKLSE
jgi:cell surface protein SprA